ncbi:MAG: hypothetical protein VX770_08140 [Candidatus Neomarinimicrobiota bacterium]|nr:hypothetical protein [Candidatus Neomarinimicrobiota bacterium]
MYFFIIINIFFSFFFAGIQECTNAPLNTILRSYSIGDTISMDDQLRVYNVCHAPENYNDNIFRLSDYNGDLNGGNYRIILISMNASW